MDYMAKRSSTILFFACFVCFGYFVESYYEVKNAWKRSSGELGSPLMLSICNNQTQFDCMYENEVKCIPIEWMCDNIVDCQKNRRDERDCRYIHSCPLNSLICRNGQCVDSVFKCNGIDDCGDASDERGCYKLPPPPECSQGFFRCSNGPCIISRARCDTIEDCPEGDDEKNCPTVPASEKKTVKCGENYFKCDNNCIRLSWICDGINDCKDHSDENEAMCNTEREEELLLKILPNLDDYHRFILNQSFCSGSEFLCEPGVCIPAEKLCDGRNDCRKENDEGGRCGECSSFHCSHKCTDHPRGPICLCPEGEQLGMDGRTCEDADECDLPSAQICAHRCVNTHPGFHCECDEGYELHADGHSCQAFLDLHASIFFSLGSEVRRFPLIDDDATEGYRVYQHNDLTGVTVRSISFNPLNDYLVLAISDKDNVGKIHSARKGLQNCIVNNIIGIANVAVDWITGNIYYTAQYPSPSPGIGVCSSNGRHCRLLIDGVVGKEYFHRQAYRGLVVNPKFGMIYWIDVPGAKDPPTIKSARMDGSEVRILVSSKLEHPQGLAIDYVKQSLYFADDELQLIQRVDIFTRERTTVASRGVHHPYDLVVFDGFVYWTDWHTEAVFTRKTESSDLPHVLRSVGEIPYGLAINHSAYWDRKIENPCKAMKCSHLCVLYEQSGSLYGKCICPNLYAEREPHSCFPLSQSEVSELKNTRRVPGLCTTQMAQYCGDGTACSNNGECMKRVGENGHVTEVICLCKEGFVGQYCEVELSYSSKTHINDTAMWWRILLIVPIVFLIGTSVCHFFRLLPAVDNLIDRLLTNPTIRDIHFGRNDEKERILNESGAVYQSDSFHNPVYKGDPISNHESSLKQMEPYEKDIENPSVPIQTPIFHIQTSE